MLIGLGFVISVIGSLFIILARNIQEQEDNQPDITEMN